MNTAPIPIDAPLSGENLHRPMLAKNVEAHEESFDKFGQLATDPLLIYDDGEKLLMLGGHHRQRAWKNR